MYERNAFAANRAVGCATYALFTDGTHLIPFRRSGGVMLETGNNLPSLYRETASAGWLLHITTSESYRHLERHD